MTNMFLTHFHKPKVLLPVIHGLEGRATQSVLKAVEVAMEAGADGVFLINQGMSAWMVASLAARLHDRHPDLWVGLNLLGVDALTALGVVRDTCARGLWLDNAMDTPSCLSTPGLPLIFGGVAFKYQAPVSLDRLGWHAHEAIRRRVDVVTTSGEGTGEAASVEKVARLRSDMPGGYPLAIASGITPENVGDYLPHADAFLVATGIESSFGVLDPDKTRRLAERIHAT